MSACKTTKSRHRAPHHRRHADVHSHHPLPSWRIRRRLSHGVRISVCKSYRETPSRLDTQLPRGHHQFALVSELTNRCARVIRIALSSTATPQAANPAILRHLRNRKPYPAASECFLMPLTCRAVQKTLWSCGRLPASVAFPPAILLGMTRKSRDLALRRTE